MDDGAQSFLHAGGVLAGIDGAGAATYTLLDGLGSVRGRADGAGAPVGSADYDAFGGVRSSTGTTGVFGWAGEERDPETGQIHLRARQYAPGLGRFLSVDPAFPGGPGTQGYGRYAYAGNNPTTWSDPSGRRFQDPPIEEVCWEVALHERNPIMRAAVYWSCLAGFELGESIADDDDSQPDPGHDCLPGQQYQPLYAYRWRPLALDSAFPRTFVNQLPDPQLGTRGACITGEAQVPVVEMTDPALYGASATPGGNYRRNLRKYTQGGLGNPTWDWAFEDQTLDAHHIFPKAQTSPPLNARFARVFQRAVERGEWQGPQLNVNDPRLMMWWPAFGIEGLVERHRGGGDSISPAYNLEWEGWLAPRMSEDEIPYLSQVMQQAITLTRFYYPVQSS